jgi:hemerythrin-like domain-containing protein
MNPIRARLAADHEELDALLTCLAEDIESPCKGQLVATWAAFESQLMRHLEAEERFLLPLVEAGNPGEVARTRAEHAQIRDAVAELGIAIELHNARKPNIVEFIAFLRQHAKHEDEALYQLAGQLASVSVETRILETLKNAVRSVARELSVGHRALP